MPSKQHSDVLRSVLRGAKGNIVLAIPDLHCPADHKRALPWVRSLADLVCPSRIVFLGDVVDHNAISFHDKYPELAAAKDE